MCTGNFKDASTFSIISSADDEFTSTMETNVVIRNDGQVMWDQPSITKSSCSVDVAFFPFDVQECHLTFGSWTHNGNQMDLFNALDTADLTDFVPNVEWEVRFEPLLRRSLCSSRSKILVKFSSSTTRFWACRPRRTSSCTDAAQTPTQISPSPST